ncbi:hypothetical protein [Flagellimonas eckloniae]|uniref:Uncharacterized protein n=1 Tax=Flagellimonas eckloniae TaxID=346185 RepID=A0A0Q1DQZ9_9FLAO|nr:hypothetical protein [Allomuricauda eckloniae]KQC31303.1 hypothetical protein AAY42_16440 [Allomuricauda eckloniae]
MVKQQKAANRLSGVNSFLIVIINAFMGTSFEQSWEDWGFYPFGFVQRKEDRINGKEDRFYRKI